MPAADQGVNLDRYMVVPRTLIFLFRRGKVLLLKGAHNKRLWAGLYNGIGGHVEQGENILFAAQRELFEETGLSIPNLLLCGVMNVDTQVNPGVCVFIFRGECPESELKLSREGTPEWIGLSEIDKLACVPDLRWLLPRVTNHSPGSPPFSVNTGYDENGKLVIDIN